MSMIDDLIKSLHKPKNIGGLIAFVIIIIIMGAVFDRAAGTTDVVPIGGRGSTLFTIRFNETNESLEPITDYTKEEETTHKDININHTNITKIVFILKWEDDVATPDGSQDDEFKLTITSPEGLNLESNFTPSNSDSSTNGEIILEVIINEIPKNTQVKADSENQAAEYNTTYFGSGSWGADIEAVDCPPDPPQPLPFMPEEQDPDQGNDWTLEIMIYYYEGEIKEVELGIPKGD